jgi:hypothetical protein
MTGTRWMLQLLHILQLRKLSQLIPHLGSWRVSSSIARKELKPMDMICYFIGTETDEAYLCLIQKGPQTSCIYARHTAITLRTKVTRASSLLCYVLQWHVNYFALYGFDIFVMALARLQGSLVRIEGENIRAVEERCIWRLKIWPKFVSTISWL